MFADIFRRPSRKQSDEEIGDENNSHNFEGRLTTTQRTITFGARPSFPVWPLLCTNELPEVEGFSERNIERMLTFYREYRAPAAIVPQAAAQIRSASKVPQPAAQLIDSILWSIPWFHHVILMEKVKDPTTRRRYMEQTLTNG